MPALAAALVPAVAASTGGAPPSPAALSILSSVPRRVRITVLHRLQCRQLVVDTASLADEWFDEACALVGADPGVVALVTSLGRAVLPEDSLASLNVTEGGVVHLIDCTDMVIGP